MPPLKQKLGSDATWHALRVLARKAVRTVQGAEHRIPISVIGWGMPMELGNTTGGALL